MYSVHHFWLYRSVKTCEVFLCFLAITFLGSIVLTFQWLPCIHCFMSLMSFTGFYTETVIPLTIFMQLRVFMSENLYPRVQVWQRSILLCLQNLSKMHKPCGLGELERHFMEFGFWIQSWYITISVLHYYRTVNLFLVCFDIIDKNVGNLVTISIIHLVMLQVRRSKMWCVIVFILL